MSRMTVPIKKGLAVILVVTMMTSCVKGTENIVKADSSAMYETEEYTDISKDKSETWVVSEPDWDDNYSINENKEDDSYDISDDAYEEEAIEEATGFFSDVRDASTYYYQAVYWAYGKGVTSGIGDGTFAPQKTCTREQLVTFLWKYASKPEQGTNSNFRDVKSNKYYSKAVTWAVKNKITTGISNTEFGVGKACTREQFVTLLWRYAGKPEPKTAGVAFKDIKKNSYYYKAVVWASENGITTGLTNNLFGKGKPCTRGQCVTFLFRYYLYSTPSASLNKLTYQPHVEDMGWTSAVNPGDIAGTTGLDLRLEALKINLNYKNGNSAIEYRAYVEDIGWQSWKTSGQVAGTEEQRKRIEGIQIRLTGEAKDLYDIYYCVHVSEFGWLGWAKNGDAAGSKDLALMVQAVKIVIVNKDTGFNVGGWHFTEKPILSTDAHISDIGWKNNISDGEIIGGAGKPLEAVKLKVTNFSSTCNITYRAHCSDIGWQSWQSQGGLAGTTGQSRSIEAFEAKLSGSASARFDLYYRTYVNGYGWFGWAKNGETAGTINGARPVEAIEFRITYKGAEFNRGGRAFIDLSKSCLYNVENAMSYAAEHCYDEQGLCAEFVSKCVQAGGIPISTERTTLDCWNAIIDATGLQGQDLILDENGYATQALDGNILKRGDVVIQWCYTHDVRPHILICSGYDSSGIALFYAHNSALNNERYKLNENLSEQHSYSCNMGAKVLHLSN